MLRIANDLLPQSLLSYVAFRVAQRWTCEGLAEFGVEGREAGDRWTNGFLAEVPVLRETALPVQVDVLADVWDRHLARETFTATLLDESVIYAVCEFTASLAEEYPDKVLAALQDGPLDVTLPVDEHFASEIRGLYLNLSNEGEFLLVSQFLDLPPDEAAEWKTRLGISDERIEPLFDVLGRWHVSPDLLGNLQGLVNVREARRLAQLLKMPIPAS